MKNHTKAKSYFVEAKFYLEHGAPKEAQDIALPSIEEVKLQSTTSKLNLLAKVENEINQNKNSIENEE